MAKRTEQLDLLTPEPSQGQIIPTSLHTEMQRSYLEYAMSVIVGRALPDVRDGLKPVHRRILYAMHVLGLVPERPYRKCARVVGDVLGKYHPHGDQSVYDALVRLVQDFSSRYPLLAGHGNFGSVDNDPPAAMRYTECRLAPIGNEALLSEINEAVIDFADNFDSSEQEPTVLPAQLPMLLLNGSSGIAVGMATNIPPHNLRELVDGAIALIDRPALSDDDLFALIPAPDFPTGGIILNDGGIREAYSTGRGSITLRGVAMPEVMPAIKGKRARSCIIVTELPFQVNKAAWIEKIAELVEHDKLQGIVDLRDESDRTGMRVVIELKKEVNPDAMIELLYKHTALQINFGVIMLALTGSLPKQMSLREILQEFISFRELTLTRRFSHEQDQAQQRLHLVDGLVSILANISATIDLIRTSEDSATAKAGLQAQFALSATQADAILAMPLRRLTGLEQQGLQTEQRDLRRQIQSLEVLLSDRRELLKVMKKDLRELKKKHGDERRSRIEGREIEVSSSPITKTVSPAAGKQTQIPQAQTQTQPQSKQKSVKAETNGQAPPVVAEVTFARPDQPAKDVIVQLTHKGYVKCVDANAKPTNSQPSSSNLADDPIVVAYSTNSDRDLIVLTAVGKAFPLAVKDIPATTAKSKNTRGTPLITLLPDAAEDIVSVFPWDKNPDTLDSLVLLTTQAKVKRSPLADFAGINARGLVAIKPKDDDRLFWANVVSMNSHLAIATSGGRILRMSASEEQIPTLGRTALGNQALRLRSTESLVGAAAMDLTADPDTELLLITAQGYAKRIIADHLRLSPRGSIGSQAIAFADKNDYLAAIATISGDQAQFTLLIGRAQDDPQCRAVQLAIDDIPLQAINGQGRAVYELGVELTRAEKVVRLTT
jgi:DNA gyrase subunit A